MDKQKQIEEMAKVIDNIQTYGTKWYPDKYEPFECRIENDDIAYELYNAGCRKEERVRKETVENFTERLKILIAERNCNEDYDWEDIQIDGQIFVECIDEIAKELIGE